MDIKWLWWWQLSFTTIKYKNMTKNNFYIISGGPGAGKTTLINELANTGFVTREEEARKIIREQLAIGGDGVPWRNKALYAQLMLKASINTFNKTKRDNGTEIIFFDRGILDTICYMNMENTPVSDEVQYEVNTCNYNKNVFILPPWKEIYQTDDERKQSWEEALFSFYKLKETYLQYGYNVIEIPKIPVSQRKEFVLDRISQDF